MDGYTVLFRGGTPGSIWLVDARLEAGQLEIGSGNGSREWFLRVAAEHTGRMLAVLSAGDPEDLADDRRPPLLARLERSFAGHSAALTEIRGILDRARIPYRIDSWTGD